MGPAPLMARYRLMTDIRRRERLKPPLPAAARWRPGLARGCWVTCRSIRAMIYRRITSAIGRGSSRTPASRVPHRRTKLREICNHSNLNGHRIAPYKW
ncbi:hypothetical protein EVAR_29361_1 [Eumeta japonica]|uniref:Uncharacterized protein n=1 Tax=Eumeta variegata TaxID=151549 RepID=A0A4C1WJC9_EUMVA|nr:hypothetical protein EVAR_29361_1 [Eumeta japonica]